MLGKPFAFAASQFKAPASSILSYNGQKVPSDRVREYMHGYSRTHRFHIEFKKLGVQVVAHDEDIFGTQCDS
jgi:hypothetical protein